MKGTTKRLMVLLGMLAMVMGTVVPAFAQQQQYGGGEVSATGVIIDELPADVAANGTHSISDEATGTLYALRSAGPDLDSYGSQRVTVYGTLTPGEGPAPGQEFGGSLPSIDVTRVEPVGGEVEPVKLTGMIESEPASGGPPIFGITDEATGERYILDAGEGADYGLYEGRRVSVEGIPRTDPNTGFNFLQVAVIRPLDGPLGNDTISATFELAAECEPPAGTTFFGLVGQQPTELTDPDGDGLYEGILTLPADFGTFPIPVAIIAGDPADPQDVIEDFGEVVLEDGDAFSADASFCDGGTQPPAPPTAGEVSATGTIERLDPEPVVVDGTEICQLSTHAVTDEATGRYHDLTSDSVDLDEFVGERVALTGTPLASPAVGGAGAERCPDLDVTGVDPAEPVDPVDPAPVVDLVDPAPVVDPVDPAPVVDPTPGVDVDGSGKAVVSGGSSNDKGGGNAVVPAPVADVDGDGSVDASDGEQAAEISGDAAEGSASSAVKVLPATGGILPTAGAVGALLIIGGLVARRIFR